MLLKCLVCMCCGAGSYLNDDLQVFFQQFESQLMGQKVVKNLGNMPNDNTTPDLEPLLDVEYIMTVGAFAPTYYYNYQCVLPYASPPQTCC